MGSVAGTIGGLDGGAEAGIACCDSSKPPAKAACIGSSEMTSTASAVSSSISPKPSIAAPKAAAKGSPTFDSTEEWFCTLETFDFSGRGFASIRRSLVNGPNSKLLDPLSVLKVILNNQAAASEGTQNDRQSFPLASILEGFALEIAWVPSMSRILPFKSHKSLADSFKISIVTSNTSSSSSSISSTTDHSVTVTPFVETDCCAMNHRHDADT